MQTDNNKYKIIIFDGVCLLCNSAVYFLHKRLRFREYKFVASQTNEGKELTDQFNLGNLPEETIVLIKENNIYTKTDALFHIVDDLPLKWSVIKIFKIVPRPIRNWAYNIISKNRHLIFGKVEGSE
ncbi:MAG: DUF393 domain-containing protein [Ignavibacteriae bacterium]|nr:DUF393 domain-containing protein [Ignavibacteriota bacterium]MCB9205743.1 DUF393 domain-containing protein [Ignavibacteriales bacterium]MCB9209905.1 DUF393 domain-containing protein [Ignavibacteriales bacterium]MCB9260267.1 DUF393 domain-containing protein [Ignavibacteriales bacterium]